METTEIDALRSRVQGSVLSRQDGNAAEAVPPQNTLVVHDPEVVVVAASEADVSEVVRFAAAHALPVRLHSTGHGATDTTGGLMIATSALDTVRVDPQTRTATIGAGARWAAVIEAAAAHSLAPITGASTNVGVVGYVLGGGLGPLSRSHGVTSDWLRSLRVVLADGSVVVASATSEPELFWALRGGKAGLGVVTEVELELAPLETIYAGSIFFDAPHVEAALRTWIDWTADAPHDVTTSIAMINMPPFDGVPEPLRGKSVLTLRFAYPGDAEEGERLAAPLRAAAPILLDGLGELPMTAVGRIHNDPNGRGASRVYGSFLDTINHEFADSFLERFGPASGSPFVSAELRHLGSAAARDVEGGSAVGGRAAGFSSTFVGIDMAREAEMPVAVADFAAWSAPWAASQTNINFVTGAWTTERLAGCWSPETFARLAAARQKYDPNGIMDFPRD